MNRLKTKPKLDSNLEESERIRLEELRFREQDIRALGYHLIAGVDEAGRGPLAGPVVAAACMMPEDLLVSGINDSKKLTPMKREQLFQILTNTPDVTFGIGIVSHNEIDRINILQATILAMRQAVDNLVKRPDYLLVDGLELNISSTPSQKIIKGDSLCYCIAAASIIAKESRDRLMLDYHNQWPEYDFASNKGYGTKKHVEALKRHGPSPIHRRSFQVRSLEHTMAST